MDDRFSRRQAIRGSAAFAGLGVIGVGSAAGHGGGDGNADGRFGVRGREVRKEKIRPEEVEVTVRKSSPDLKKRYGQSKATISRTETYDRPKPEEDDLPVRDTRTKTSPWEAEIATEDEWREAFTGSSEESVGERKASVSTTDHSYREDYYNFGLFEYEKTDGLFERTAPMNVISPHSISGVVGVLDSNGYTTYVVQYDRYAWDSDQYTFRTQDRSAATGTFGFLGRKHVKFWEFGGYVSGSAHVDSSVPHEATSFEDAEQHIEGKFDDVSGWYGYDDYYDVNNGSFLDHDGASTGLFRY